ncbi:hypothetical protein BAE44_0012955, partial [Dichanthelium oligosanthes]
LAFLVVLGSDAVAIYALATLFNRHQKQEWVLSINRSGAGLQVLWGRQSDPLGAPWRAERHNCLQHRRQRAMAATCPNSSVSGECKDPKFRICSCDSPHFKSCF